MDKSGKSRPPRGGKEAGRERLLEAARSLFRTKTSFEVSRQDIARHAGVAPGLLTYYFQTNNELVLAATTPVLAEATTKLFDAIEASASIEDRFRAVIMLFLDFAQDNAPILDVFVNAAIESGNAEAGSVIGRTLDELHSFFLQALEAGLLAKDTDPRFLLLALWGVCRLVAAHKPFPLELFPTDMPHDARRQAQAELVLRFVLHGVGTSTQVPEPKKPRRRVRINAPRRTRREASGRTGVRP